MKKEASQDVMQHTDEFDFDSVQFELDMIRYILMLDPANHDIPIEEMDKLVNEEYMESRG